MHDKPGSFIMLSLLMLAIALPSTAADESKIIRLEQDVRKLEQEVRDLSRQVAELRRNSGGASLIPAPAASAPAPAPPAESPRWLRSQNWQRLRPGMSELQVAEALGPPTSTRTTQNSDTIWFYALEIGTDSFLGGSVLLREGKVVEVKAPVLK